MNALRQRLLRLRDDLRRDLASDILTLARDLEEKGEDTTASQHPGDVAADLYAREELVVEELTLRQELADVDEALRRMDAGSYGRCVDCDGLIPIGRLVARPQAARCLTCQRRSEARRRVLALV
jgi:RNA polymerase-binding transcription factor DksA